MIFLGSKEQIGILWTILTVLCGISPPSFAQNVPVYQTGKVTRGHAVMWQAPGVGADAGGPGNGALTGVGVTNTGLPNCINDAPTSSPTGYHQLCFGANATIGAATPTPGGGSGAVVGPGTSTLGDFAVWNNAVGSLLKDLAETGSFWSSDTPPANVGRAYDRLFVGDQLSQYSGNAEDYGSTPACSGAPGAGCTWVGSTQTLTGVFSYLEREGQFLSYSQVGEMAGFFASRTSDTAAHGEACCSMPLATFTYNNYAPTTGQQTAWGSYHTLVRAAGSGGLIGTEWDIGNLGSTEIINPYGGVGTGFTQSDLLINCGGEISATSLASGLNPCSDAINIGNNGQKFYSGIVMNSNALQSTSTGYDAIQLAAQYQVEWWAQVSVGVGTLAAYISSNVTTSADQNGLYFENGGATFLGPTGAKTFVASQFDVGSNNNDVNYVETYPAPTTMGPVIAARGTDTNINLQLAGQGATGTIEFAGAPSWTANASTATAITSVGPAGAHTTVQEWLTVLDSNGVTRYIPAF